MFIAYQLDGVLIGQVLDGDEFNELTILTADGLLLEDVDPDTVQIEEVSA